MLIRRRSLYDDIVHLKVGPEKIDFGIHKNLLCSASSWFKEVLTAGSTEAQEGVIHLPDDRLNILEYFNDWLYTDSLNDPETSKPLSTWRLLLDIYLWAGYRGVPGLQNIAVDTMRANIKPEDGFPITMVSRVYNGTPRGNKLRALVVASHSDVHGESFEKAVAYAEDSGDRSPSTTEPHPPRAFLYELILLQKEKLDALGADSNLLRTFDRCHFHVHPDGGSCLKTSSQ